MSSYDTLRERASHYTSFLFLCQKKKKKKQKQKQKTSWTRRSRSIWPSSDFFFVEGTYTFITSIHVKKNY